MRRVFTLLIVMLTFTVFAWGEQKASFPNPTVSLSGEQTSYTQKIWWDDDAAYYHGNLPDDWAYKEFDYTWVSLSGDLDVTFLGSHDDDGNYLNGVKVEFTGTKGSIEITARNNVPHDGQYFECSFIIYYNMFRRVWDFNTKQYQYSNTTWMWSENNRTELIDRPGSTETRTFLPYSFKVNDPTDATYFISGIEEGLKFAADAGKFGSNNPQDGNGSERYERFLAFGEGGKITIPSAILLQCANPRIRIKMTRAGDKRHLTVVNGKDALGKPIDSDYIIGGSQWRDYPTYKDNNYRGEYHFSVQSKETDFSITNNSEDWLLLLYVEVYDSPEVISENTILGDKYQLLNNGEYDNNNYGSNGEVGTYYLHYYGMGERASLDFNTVSTTGTVTYDSDRFKSVDDFNTNYISKVGEFGTFRMRLNCHTFNNSDNKSYCTDFAWRTQSVGYMQYKRYPYTWDFTDVKPYAENNMSKEQHYADGYDNQGTTNFIRNQWESTTDGLGEHVAVDAGHNVLFCGGSQLWCGQNIFPETAGLGFQPSNYDASYNNAMTMTNEGLTIAQDIRSWWLWRIIVPQVASDEVIYVRAHRLPQETIDNPLYGNPKYPDEPEKVQVPFYNAGYYYGDADYKQAYVPFATEGNVPKMYSVVANDQSGDIIYVIPGDAQKKNVTLFFSGVTIKKIAVSKDPKAVNIKGWATESRHRIIDPELTGYMTGTNLQTFIVNQQPTDYTVSLTRIDDQGVVMDAVPEGSDNNAACIIFNKDPNYVDEGSETEEGITPNKVEILDGKFHLFVPDMHDYDGTENALKKLMLEKFPNNQLKSAVEPNTDVSAGENGNTNYVLNYKGYHEVTGQRVIGKECFYRVQKNGIKSAGNQAYLPVGNSASILMFNLSFDDSDINGIDEALSPVLPQQNGIYYNMSGQRINGVPTSRGLYIVNGKKVIVK